MARYASVADVKLALRSPEGGGWEDGGTWDVAIGRALEAAEEQIDEACGRTFSTDSHEARPFRAGRNPTILLTADFALSPFSPESVVLKGATSSEADTTINADLWRPYVMGSEYSSGVVWPARHLEAVNGGAWMPGRTYEVTATWGWNSVPDAIKQASIQLAMRIFREQDAPLGLVRGDDGTMAYVSRIDRLLDEVVGKFGGKGGLVRA